jgi:hypothetical protein
MWTTSWDGGGGVDQVLFNSSSVYIVAHVNLLCESKSVHSNGRLRMGLFVSCHFITLHDVLTLASSRAGNKGDVLGYIYIFCWSGKRNINLLRDSSWKVLYNKQRQSGTLPKHIPYPISSPI